MIRTTKRYFRILLSSLLGIGALGAAMPAAAIEPIIMMTRIQSSSFGESAVRVPLDGLGRTTTPTFTAHPAKPLVVSYTAECANDSTSTRSYVTLDIVLINADTGAARALPPTNTGSDAFCASNGVASGGWSMNTVHAMTASLPAGRYRVEVWARTVDGGLGGLDDSSLVVWHY